MKTIVAVLIITLVSVAAVRAEKGGPKNCDANFVNMVCGADGQKRGETMVNQSQMSADCKTKVIAAMKTLAPEKDKVCAGKSDVTKTCEGLNNLFMQMKSTVGEDCRPK